MSIDYTYQTFLVTKNKDILPYFEFNLENTKYNLRIEQDLNTALENINKLNGNNENVIIFFDFDNKEMEPLEFLKKMKESDIYKKVAFFTLYELPYREVISIIKQGAIDFIRFDQEKPKESEDISKQIFWAINASRIEINQIKLSEEEYGKKVQIWDDWKGYLLNKSKLDLIAALEKKEELNEGEKSKVLNFKQIEELEDYLYELNKREKDKIPKMNLLMIEDEAELRDVFSTIINKEGKYNIYLAETGTEGVEIIEKEKIDIVILDIMLPDGKGVKLFWITHKWPEMETIVFSAYKDNEIIANTVGKGAYDYITKQEDLDILMTSIDSAAEKIHYFRKIPELISDLG
ncbi:response regulator [Candidatus Margulisiibacteriota bacterium]